MAITRSGFLSLALGGLVTVSGLAACGGNSTASGDEASTSDSSVKLALLVTESGLGDQGFNDLTYDGLKRAESELGIGFDYAEPKQVSDFRADSSRPEQLWRVYHHRDYELFRA